MIAVIFPVIVIISALSLLLATHYILETRYDALRQLQEVIFQHNQLRTERDRLAIAFQQLQDSQNQQEKIHTSEAIQKLDSKYKQLQRDHKLNLSECNELRQQIIKVRLESDQKLNAVRKKHDQLNVKNQQLHSDQTRSLSESNRLRQELNKVLLEHDEELAAAHKEQGCLNRKLQQLQTEQRLVQSENDEKLRAVCAERDDLNITCQQLEHQKGEVSSERNRLHRQLGKEQSDKNQRVLENVECTQGYIAVCEELDKLKTENIQLKGELDSIRSEYAFAQITGDERKNALDNSCEQIGQLQNENNQLVADDSKRKEELSRLRRDYEYLETTYKSYKKKLGGNCLALGKSQQELHRRKQELNEILHKYEELGESHNQKTQELNTTSKKRERLQISHEHCQEELVDVRKQLRNMTSAKQCCVCFDRERVVLLQPCKHLCICEECLSDVQKERFNCLVCNMEVERFEVINSL